MADVARRAGVHPTTVSMALRNHPSIPVSTRDRIRALAERMGYAPDPLLGALVAYRNQANRRPQSVPFAYVTHCTTRFEWKTFPAHARFFEGAEARARQLGYRLEHFWAGEPELSHARLGSILSSRGITGLIIASHLPQADTHLNLDWNRFSAVKIDYYPHQTELHTVTNDHRTITQLAFRNVVAAGYRKIGMVMPGWWDDFADHAWSAGFLGEQQFLDAEDRIPIYYFPDPPGYTNMTRTTPKLNFERWIRQYRPEVLISRESFLMPKLKELGLSVPRDIAFVEMYLEPDGRTAGVRHNCDRVGELAVEILAAQLQQHTYGIPKFPTTTLVEGTWFDGDSLPRRAAAAPIPTIS